MDVFDFIPDGSTPENEIIKLNQCNCCQRHKVNKPKKLEPWIELPYNNTSKSNFTCLCDCRHKARWICRKYA